MKEFANDSKPDLLPRANERQHHRLQDELWSAYALVDITTHFFSFLLKTKEK